MNDTFTKYERAWVEAIGLNRKIRLKRSARMRRDLPCSECGALVGAGCVTSGGRPRSYPHSIRSCRNFVNEVRETIEHEAAVREIRKQQAEDPITSCEIRRELSGQRELLESIRAAVMGEQEAGK